MLRFLTAGESHGQALVVILDGMPAGLALDARRHRRQLQRRQGGYGRGRRMAIESDRAQILSGVRHGRTTGAPIALLIRNSDWANWQQTMQWRPSRPRRPAARSAGGHASASRPRGPRRRRQVRHDDMRDVLERASARETAARVAAGALARQLLGAFGIDIASATSPRSAARRSRRTSAPSPSTRIARHPGRLAAALRRSPRRGGDDRRHRRGAGGRRHAGRRLRGDRARRAARARQPRAVGPQARRPPRAGADVDPRHQGRGIGVGAVARRGRGPRSTTRSSARGREACHARPWWPRAADEQRGRPRRRRHQRRGPPRHRLHEADRHADEAAAVGRPAATLDPRPPPSNAATSAPCRRRPSSARRWSRSSWPTRSSRSSAATPWRDRRHARRVARALAAAPGSRPHGRARELTAPTSHAPPHPASTATTSLHRAGRARRARSPAEIEALIDDMVETMYAAPGRRASPPRRSACRCASSSWTSRSGRDPNGLIVFVNPEFVERDGMQLEEEGCLSVPGFNATVARPAARRAQGARPPGPRAAPSKAPGCWRAPSSTRWIISTARSSSTGCAASSAT